MKSAKNAKRIRNAWRNAAGTTSVARVLGCPSNDVHGYIVVAHTHDGDECTGGITMAGNVEQAMTVGLLAAALVDTQRMTRVAGHYTELPPELLGLLLRMLNTEHTEQPPDPGSTPYL